MVSLSSLDHRHRFTELPGPCGRVPEMLGVSRTCNVRAGITVAKWSCARLRVLSSSASNTSPAVPPDSPGGPHLKGLTVSLRPAWNDIHPSAVVHPDAILGEAISIGPFCTIGPGARLGNGCTMQANSHIYGDTELGERCVMYSGAVVGADIPGRTVLGDNNSIGYHAVVGVKCQDMKYKEGDACSLIIGNNNDFREYVSVHRSSKPNDTTTIGNDNLVMGSSHIAHDCKLGNRNILANGTLVGGHVVMEDFVHTGGAVAVHQLCHVGSYAFLAGGSMVDRDVPMFMMVAGDRAVLRGLNLEGMRRCGFSDDEVKAIRRAYQKLFMNSSPDAGGLEDRLSELVWYKPCMVLHVRAEIILLRCFRYPHRRRYLTSTGIKSGAFVSSRSRCHAPVRAKLFRGESPWTLQIQTLDCWLISSSIVSWDLLSAPLLLFNLSIVSIPHVHLYCLEFLAILQIAYPDDKLLGFGPATAQPTRRMHRLGHLRNGSHAAGNPQYMQNGSQAASNNRDCTCSTHPNQFPAKPTPCEVDFAACASRQIAQQ